MRGLQEGLATESAIKQEVAIACLLLPLSFFIARDVWTWVALVASLLFVLSIEFLNTAIERLCNHIQPDRHEAIRITKDLASAGRVLRARSRRSRLDRRALGALCGLIGEKPGDRGAKLLDARALARRGGEDLRIGRGVLGQLACDLGLDGR